MNNNLVRNITGISEFNPDILETIADLSNDEVFTPPKIANNVLDLLPSSVWHNPHLKWLDPAVKTGVFLREAAKRLMEGLSDPKTEDANLKYQLIHDEQFRREWIYKKMLFGIAITELTSLMARRSLYYTINASDPALSVVPMETDNGNILFKELKHSYEQDKKGNLKGSCLKCGASLEWHRKDDLESHAYAMLHASETEIITWFKEANSDIKNEENMKFDVIIGNPPYQLDDGGNGASASPLYQKFVEKAKQFDPCYISMIIPSRWFAGGKGLSDFRKDMCTDKRISYIKDFVNAKECFPGISLGGGVSYFLWDYNNKQDYCTFINVINGKESIAQRKLDEFPVLVRYNKALSIIKKIQQFNEASLSEIVEARNPFGIVSSFRGEDNPSKNKIKLYSSGGISFMDKSHISSPEKLKKYKVMLSKVTSEHAGEPDKNGKFKILSSLQVLNPNEACTDSYLTIGSFDTYEESRNLLAYLETKFARFLIMQAISSINLSKDKFIFLPQQDFKQYISDDMLFEKYNLSEDETEFIGSLMKEIS